MYYIKLVFLNIIRQKKYSMSLFAAMLSVSLALTVVLGIYTASSDEIEKTAAKYTTVVTPRLYPMQSQVYNIQKTEIEPFDYEFVREIEKYPEVQTAVYQKPSMYSCKLWQFIYSEEDFSEDIHITDPMLMSTVSADEVSNSEYISGLELSEGEFIGNDANADGTIPILVTSLVAEKTGIKVNDVVVLSQEPYAQFESDKFLISGIVKKHSISNELRIFLPRNAVEEYHERAGISYEGEGNFLNLVFSPAFVLNSPEDADSFISKTYDTVTEKGYIMQADDYEYKKEVYPLRMMLEVNNMIGGGILILGVVLLIVLLFQSIRVKEQELVVYRLISMNRKVLISVSVLEKAIILVPAVLSGILLGLCVMCFAVEIHSLTFLLYSFLSCFILVFVLLTVCLAVFSKKSNDSLMGEMSNGK